MDWPFEILLKIKLHVELSGPFGASLPEWRWKGRGCRILPHGKSRARKHTDKYRKEQERALHEENKPDFG